MCEDTKASAFVIETNCVPQLSGRRAASAQFTPQSVMLVVQFLSSRDIFQGFSRKFQRTAQTQSELVHSGWIGPVAPRYWADSSRKAAACFVSQHVQLGPRSCAANGSLKMPKTDFLFRAIDCRE